MAFFVFLKNIIQLPSISNVWKKRYITSIVFFFCVAHFNWNNNQYCQENTTYRLIHLPLTVVDVLNACEDQFQKSVHDWPQMTSIRRCLFPGNKSSLLLKSFHDTYVKLVPSCWHVQWRTLKFKIFSMCLPCQILLF